MSSYPFSMHRAVGVVVCALSQQCFSISNTSINGKKFTKFTVGRDTWKRVDIILLCVREKLNYIWWCSIFESE